MFIVFWRSTAVTLSSDQLKAPSGEENEHNVPEAMMLPGLYDVFNSGKNHPIQSFWSISAT